MKTHKYAKRYAAMFLGAVGIEAAPGAIGEIALVNALMQKSLELKRLLGSPLFSDGERAKALEAVGERIGLSETTIKFVNYLAAEGAAWALGDVINRAVAIYSEKKNRVTATVITPVPVNGDYEGRLKEALRRITRKEVSIEYTTDPGILGGMLVKVGSTMFDGSIQGQLRLLKDELVKG